VFWQTATNSEKKSTKMPVLMIGPALRRGRRIIFLLIAW
jgi:hypothetical protein